MFEITFQNKSHQNRFYSYIAAAQIGADDTERLALFYILALDFVSDHITQIYNFETNRLKALPEDILANGWITGGSRRALNLAFNLFNGFHNDDTTPLDLMDYGNVEYYLQAIRIRFLSE